MLDRFLQKTTPEGLLLASDFDGTLSKIVPEPGAAETVPGVIHALTELSQRLLAIAIVSGRSTADLERLVPVPGLRRLGDYGLMRPTEREADALAAFNQDVRAHVESKTGLAVEAKPGSTSVHFRDAPEAGDRLFDTISETARRHGLEASLGRMVVEVRPHRAGKGRAVERLMTELSPSAMLFAGDDEGDREVFELLSASTLPHLAIGIRSPEARGDLFEHCDLVLEGPEEFSRCLRTLAAWAARPGPARPGSDA